MTAFDDIAARAATAAAASDATTTTDDPAESDDAVGIFRLTVRRFRAVLVRLYERIIVESKADRDTVDFLIGLVVSILIILGVT